MPSTLAHPRLQNEDSSGDADLYCSHGSGAEPGPGAADFFSRGLLRVLHAGQLCGGLRGGLCGTVVVGYVVSLPRPLTAHAAVCPQRRLASTRTKC